MQKILLCTLWCLGMMVSTMAQVQVRRDDHFFKRRVVNRISLGEKINAPLVYHESAFYSDNQQFSEQDGIVSSLINGLKAGKYVAFHPDQWDKTLNYDQLLKRMQEFDEALEIKGEGSGDWYDEGSRGGDEVFGAGEEEIWDDNNNEQDWEDDWEDDLENDVLEEEEDEQGYEMDLGPYEEVLHMVEDRIFDKNRSMMVNEIDFFEIIWVDPSGALPEKVLARFKWADVKDQLKNTKWKTRYNDATGLSIAQAFELRMFHSFLINVGGNGVRTLWEAENRRQELIEFEHHLWSY